MHNSNCFRCCAVVMVNVCVTLALIFDVANNWAAEDVLRPNRNPFPNQNMNVSSKCCTYADTPLNNFFCTALLWIIPRKCPKEPLGELFWDVQTCNTDRDCWPRICCPDGTKKYCRTSKPELDTLPYPAARQLSYRKWLQKWWRFPKSFFAGTMLVSFSNRIYIRLSAVHTATTIGVR